MGLWQDLRYAIRLLVKDKWLTAVAAAALALGIGVNNTVFTFVNAVLIRGLPFDEPDRIMALGTRDRVRDREMGVSYLDFKDWTAAARSFSGLAAYGGNVFNVSDEGRPPERYRGPYSVAQRTQEIGVRMALGARPAQVRWLVLRRGLVQTAIGLVLGLAGAVGGGRLLESILVQTSTRDAVTLISVVFLLAVVSIAACLAPARRATRLDPLVALRYE